MESGGDNDFSANIVLCCDDATTPAVSFILAFPFYLLGDHDLAILFLLMMSYCNHYQLTIQ
jgi:hypothetical protein